MSLSAAALGWAFGLDVLVGEPSNRFHPVAWFGRLVDALDRSWARPRLAGVVVAASLPVGTAAAVGACVLVATLAHQLVGLALGALVVFATTSFRELLATVAHVGRLADEDLPAARAALPALAGRDASTLSADDVRSAAVESLAENLADGLVGPLSYFGIGAALAGVLGTGPPATLAVACACAVWVTAVDTMDSMLGYPDRALGTGAARLDDVAMWVPARASAVLLAGWFADPGALRRAAAWQSTLASPNAGWPMGTIAAALDVRLEKPGHYTLNPTAESPTQADVRRALGRVGLAGLTAYALAGVLAWS